MPKESSLESFLRAASCMLLMTSSVYAVVPHQPPTSNRSLSSEVISTQPSYKPLDIKEALSLRYTIQTLEDEFDKMDPTHTRQLGGQLWCYYRNNAQLRIRTPMGFATFNQPPRQLDTVFLYEQYFNFESQTTIHMLIELGPFNFSQRPAKEDIRNLVRWKGQSKEAYVEILQDQFNPQHSKEKLRYATACNH